MAKEILNLEVKSNIKSVTKDTDNLEKSLSGIVGETEKIPQELDKVASGVEKADSATKDLNRSTTNAKRGFGGIATAVRGVGTALKAAGIGLALAAVAAFVNVAKSNQSVLNFFSTAVSGITIAFNDLFNYLSDNIETVKGYFTSLFDDPQESMKEFAKSWHESMQVRVDAYIATLGILAKTVKQLFEGEWDAAWQTTIEAGKQYVDVFTGVEGSFETLKESAIETVSAITQYTATTWEQAEALTAAALAAARAQVEFAKLNAQYLKEAEDQRQIRDDETKTFAVRIAANEELSAVLEKQQNLQKAALQTQEKALQLAYDITSNDANWIALQTAKIALLELEETITGQASEQKTNQVTLEKELRDAIAQTLAEGMSGRERELQELKTSYEEKIRLADKAGMDTSAITEQYEKEQQAIRDSYNALEIAAEKATEDAKAKIRDANIANIESGIALVKSLAGENREIQAAAIIAENAVGVAKTIINTQAANSGATLKYAALPGGIALAAAEKAANNIAAGIAIASSVAAAAQGLSALGKGGATGGNNPDSPSSSASTPSPQMMSGAFQLEGGQEVQPMQAYVVSDDITDSQNGLAIIRRRATI